MNDKIKIKVRKGFYYDGKTFKEGEVLIISRNFFNELRDFLDDKDYIYMWVDSRWLLLKAGLKYLDLWKKPRNIVSENIKVYK